MNAPRFPNPFRFVAAIWRACVAFLKGDQIIASGLLQWRREAKCANCESYDSAFDQCRECSCFIRLKTILKTESCPLKKW